MFKHIVVGVDGREAAGTRWRSPDCWARWAEGLRSPTSLRAMRTPTGAPTARPRLPTKGVRRRC
jgi:hypothetical protein